MHTKFWEIYDKRVLYDAGGQKMVTMTSKVQIKWILLLHFWGGGGQRRNAKKGRDVSVRVDVTLEDIYNGAERTAEIERRVICRGCKKNPRKNVARVQKVAQNEIKKW